MSEEEQETREVRIPIRRGSTFSRNLVECIDDLQACRLGVCNACDGANYSDRITTRWDGRMGPFDSIGLPINQGTEWMSVAEFRSRYRRDEFIRELYQNSAISRGQMLDLLGEMR